MKKKIKKASEEKHLMSLMSQIKKKNSDFFDVRCAKNLNI